MDILNEIKIKVLDIEPDAEVFLFGSRARGDSHSDSDWDILILLPDFANFKIKSIISEKLYDVEIKYSVLLNLIYRKKNTWFNDKVFKESPFYQNVVKEYKRL
jgi:predicted nucleotidyltransferase